MNCYDCDAVRPAVAVCSNCGAGLCREHAAPSPQTVTRLQGMGVSTMPATARRIMCTVCAQGHTY